MLNEIAPRTRPNRDDADQVPGGRDIQAPFADEVLRLRRTRPFSEPIVSFHALPWGQGRSLAGAGPIGEKYRQLFGEAFLDTEMTHSAGVLDSYFQPSAGLDLAQHLAAEAFRADYTFFIVFGALAGTGERILVDRTAHQSIYMPAGQSSASVDYAPAAAGLPPAGQPLSDIVQLLEMVAAAADVGTPDDTIVLAACSYDGVLYNLHRIMSECLALSPATAFLVDEAWSAINTFHSGLRPLTALNAAHRIAASGTLITVRVTQSAHKSMSAAWQGSYLHVAGEPALIAGVASTLYGRHTTSPSIPSLASLDLARAHAQSHGQRLLQRSLDLAAGARRAVNDDPALSAYRMLPEPAPAGINRDYLTADPTKLLIGTTGLRRSGQDVRLRLFHDYGIYISRTLPDAFLVNFPHRNRRRGRRPATSVAAVSGPPHTPTPRRHASKSRYPGRRHTDRPTPDRLPARRPLAVPGERWAPTLRQRVAASRRSRAEVYQLPPGPSRHPPASTSHDTKPAGNARCAVNRYPARQRRQGTACPAAAPHWAAANTYTRTRVPGHEPGAAAGAGDGQDRDTAAARSATHGGPDAQRDQRASNANRPGNSMRTHSVIIRVGTAASDRTSPPPTSVTTTSEQL